MPALAGARPRPIPDIPNLPGNDPVRAADVPAALAPAPNGEAVSAWTRLDLRAAAMQRVREVGLRHTPS